MNRLAACALAVTFLAPSAVFAGDREAQRFYDKAKVKWDDENPQLPIKYALKALEHAENPIMRANVLFMLGRLQHSRMGDFAKAVEYYEMIIKETRGTKDDTLKRIKADAFRNLGNIIYAEQGDIKKALTKYNASHLNYPTPETADTLSQFLFRIGRNPNSAKAARDKQVTTSVKLAREAVEMDGKQRTRDPAMTAKYRLQLVIALIGAGKQEEADAVWAETKQEKLTANSLYQQAQLMALKKGDGAAIAKLLTETLYERPTPKTRNDLRKFIRSEHDFADYRKREDWKDLVADEAEGEKPAADEKPASRPSK